MEQMMLDAMIANIKKAEDALAELEAQVAKKRATRPPVQKETKKEGQQQERPCASVDGKEEIERVEQQQINTGGWAMSGEYKELARKVEVSVNTNDIGVDKDFDFNGLFGLPSLLTFTEIHNIRKEQNLLDKEIEIRGQKRLGRNWVNTYQLKSEALSAINQVLQVDMRGELEAWVKDYFKKLFEEAKKHPNSTFSELLSRFRLSGYGFFDLHLVLEEKIQQKVKPILRKNNIQIDPIAMINGRARNRVSDTPIAIVRQQERKYKTGGGDHLFRYWAVAD